MVEFGDRPFEAGGVFDDVPDGRNVVTRPSFSFARAMARRR
ncbi:hypothetical protein ACFQL1_19080 [Halomicroarcula sp. GCM10025709]